MQLISLALFLPLLAAHAIPLHSRQNTIDPCRIVANYTVVSGDTLGKIATTYNSTVAAIVYVNPSITNPDLIFPDEVIAIPASECNTTAPELTPTTPSTCAAAGTATPYIVQSGDYLSLIADHFGITLAALEAANPQITNPDLILVGDAINIPICESDDETTGDGTTDNDTCE